MGTLLLGPSTSFAFSSTIIRDDLVGRRENSLSRAVVLFQADDGAIGKSFSKSKILRIVPRESVDRLIVIPLRKGFDDGRQKVDQLILHLFVSWYSSTRMYKKRSL